MIGRPTKTPKLMQGLTATFDVLTKTHNEAAVDVLLAALDHPNADIQDGALAALLERRTVRGHREIISRLANMDQRRREIVLQNPRYLGRALRESIQTTDRKQCEVGCSTIVWLREYDLMPALLHEAENNTNPNQELAATNVLELVEHLYQELALPSRNSANRDPKLTRQHVLHSLERSLARFGQHKRHEVVEAFLILAPRDHLALRRILADPMHEAYLTVVEHLTHSPRGGVIRLLLSFLDDSQSASAAMAVLGRRTDAKFLEHFLRKIGARPSAIVAQNLRRIDTVAWLQGDLSLLDSFDDEAQVGAVQLAVRSGIHRSAAFTLIAYMIRRGKPCARRAAVSALTAFRGTEANELAMAAAQDVDPQVQALALMQLRSRGIPSGLAVLLTKLDSPHEAVRSAVRGSLDEFSCDRFQAAFDMLDDHVRKTTGAVVRKVDLQVTNRLREELKARSRTRRLRGVAMICAMDLVPDLLPELIDRLSDEDHLIRVEAVKALAVSTSPHAATALRQALNDRSVAVQEAAQWSLDQGYANSLVSEAFAAALAAEEQELPLRGIATDERADSDLDQDVDPAGSTQGVA